MEPKDIKYENLAERASLIIEMYDNAKMLDGVGIPVHFNGLLKSKERLLELEQSLSLALALVKNNLDLYQKHGDFSQWWNSIRFDEYEKESIEKLPKSSHKTQKEGFVYLMIDDSTGYYKIGFAKEPKIRERTLQAQKPTIRIIGTRIGTFSDEKSIQLEFQYYRMRGEWFDIPELVLPTLMRHFN